jgi:PKD repeat protein
MIRSEQWVKKSVTFESLTQPSHMRKLILVASFIISSTLLAQAQQQTCGTDYAVRKSLEMHPELVQERQALEDFTSQYEPTGERVVRVIPIVFHVIHNYGAENISKEQILDALRIINEDFRLQNEDQTSVIPAFQGIVADMEVEFRLAKIDPSGNCTEGITRTVSDLTFSADNNVKALVSWPRNKYLNVWVVESISFGAGGYAYLPGSAPSAGEDGIVVINRQLGSIGTSNGSNFSARTLTHEIGHFLNLNHTWGGSNSPGETANCNTDDNVSDTPNTIGVANQTCDVSQTTCGSLDNVQNYMDYATCAIMYTNGQKTRVQAALSSSTAGRSTLWSAANLAATGVSGTAQVCSPIADFKVSSDQSCANTNITFTDLSYNATIDGTWQWNWSFPGGTPSSSIAQNPVVQYLDAGPHTVTLNVSNATGSNSKTKSNVVYISTDVPEVTAPIIEGMEISSFPIQNGPNANWRFESSNANAFSRTTAAAATGEASLIYNNLNVATDVVSSMYSPVINCSFVGTPANLKFKVAYARRNSTTNDKLEVWISSDCGRTWARRYSKNGSALATTGGFVNSSFVPNSTQWREESVSVIPLAGQPRAMIKFTVIDSSGNNIYLDDINIVDAPIGFADIQLDDYATEIYPNPGKGDATIAYSLIKSNRVVIEMTDISGRILGSRTFGNQQPGDYKTSIRDIYSNQPSSGVYFLRITAGNHQLTRKWICN